MRAISAQHALSYGVWGHAPPGNFCIIRLSKIVSGGNLTFILHSVKSRLYNTEYQFQSQDSMVSAALPPSQVAMPHVKMPHLFICHAHVTNVPHIIGLHLCAIRIYWYVRHPLRIQRTETERDFFTARSRVGHGVR